MKLMITNSFSESSFQFETSELTAEFQPRLLVLATEAGLPSQDYQCFECSTLIGVIYGPALVCSFTGKYYCSKCHHQDHSVIPARVLFNWDFQMRPICRRAREFLSKVGFEAF